MTRTRIEQPIYLGYEIGNDGIPSQQWYTPLTAKSTITLGDTGRYGYPRFPSRGNVGGALNLVQSTTNLGLMDVGTVWFGTNGGALGQHYVGKIAVKPQNPTMPVSTGDGSSRAAEAYNRMKPTKPLYSANLNALYELREVPEMLRQRFLHNGLKDIANYHLALQFGWKPLLQDIVNFVTSQRKMQERLKWLLAHNGKPVRRFVELASFSVDPVTTINHPLGSGSLLPSLVTGYISGGTTQSTLQTAGERWWASARFRYWLPAGPRDVVWRRAILARLYGLKPTPAVIYNAIPWSWLNDWFSNTGDILANMDVGVADRLANDYFYMMRHNWAKCTTTATFHLKGRDNVPLSVTSTSTVTTERKTRVEGDRFGFATNPNSLTGMQLSILGALGLSRL